MAVGDLVTGDYECEYRGFGFGGSTGDFLLAPGSTGLADMPAVTSSDRQRLRRHGLYAGDDFMLGRELVLYIEVNASDAATWAANVETLKTAFRVDPTRREDPLIFQVPGIAGGGKRRILCRPRGLRVPQDLDWFYQLAVVAVRLEATSPFLLDDTPTSVASSILTPSSSGLTWPLTWPLTWGSVEATSFTVTNAGTSPAEWVAEFHGPVTNPAFTHVTQNRSIEVDLDIGDGDRLVVDSSDRTVLLNGTASRYSSLTTREWFDLDPGANELTYRADAGAGSMTLTFRSTWT